MLSACFGRHRWQHFLPQHISRTQSIATICRSTVLSSHGDCPSRPGIRVESPVQASQLLVHILFPSIYLVSTPVNNLHTVGETVAETHGMHVPLELSFCLGWCKRCTEQWKINLLSMSSWHTLSQYRLPLPWFSWHHRAGHLSTSSSSLAWKPRLSGRLLAFTVKDMEETSWSSLLTLLCRR